MDQNDQEREPPYRRVRRGDYGFVWLEEETELDRLLDDVRRARPEGWQDAAARRPEWRSSHPCIKRGDYGAVAWVDAEEPETDN